MPSDTADELVASAVDELYGADPETFLDRRTALVKQARADGAGTASKQIAALRKPTRSAYAINLLARTDPAAVQRLLDLGEQWRAAEMSAKSVDADQIRELTRTRRRLIDELTRAAFTATDERNPSSAVRDEVVATLTAALSDEAVAGDVERGVLVKPARWEGFGFGGPELTLVPTIGDGPATAARPSRDRPAGRTTGRPADRPPDPEAGDGRPARPVRLSPAERRAAREAQQQAQAQELEQRRAQAERDAAQALADARHAVDEAQDNLVLATDEEQARVDRVRELEEEIAEARRAVDGARRDVRRAEIAQRRAQDALRRLERSDDRA
ncbi:hypothetical protein [Nakamurella sp.]|uniref:hypothetical protein n=1 Tax=Nakamurella sp. TaxID=1869182 RepID=UPI00378350E2